MLEETEGYREIIKSTSQASDEGHGMQCFEAELHEKSGSDEEQMRVLECGRWAVEARRTGREKSKSNGGRKNKNKTQARSKARKCVSEKKKQSEETRAESTGELEVTRRFSEVRTGRGSAGLVRGRDERCWADETREKGNGKGNGRRGSMKAKGFGSKGTQQGTRTMKDDDEEEELEERGRVAPYMGGGSHPQAISDLAETEGEDEPTEGEVRGPRSSFVCCLV